MTTPVSTGSTYICRREVYDVLAAAHGVLPYTRLRRLVEPRLRKYLSREIDIDGGVDHYLRERLARYQHPDPSGDYRAMLEIRHVDSVETVNLRSAFVMRRPDGKPYVAGSAAALETMDRISQNIMHSREREDWDFLPPHAPRRPMKKSMKVVGWMSGQNVIADSTGTVIDGRVRCELADEMGMKCPQPVKVNNRGLPAAHGVIYAYFANEVRLSELQRAEYIEKVEEKLKVKWEDFIDLYLLTYDLSLAPPTSPITDTTDIEMPDGRKVQVGGPMIGSREYVKLRDIMKYAGLPEFDGKKVKQVMTGSMALEDVIQPNKDGSQATIYFRVSDMPEVGTKFPDSAWPKRPGRAKQLRDAVNEIYEVIMATPR